MQPICIGGASIARPAVCDSSENPELSEHGPIGLYLSGRLMPVWHREDTSNAARADIRRADLSLSLFISCLACNHPVSAQAAA